MGRSTMTARLLCSLFPIHKPIDDGRQSKRRCACDDARGEIVAIRTELQGRAQNDADGLSGQRAHVFELTVQVSTLVAQRLALT